MSKRLPRQFHKVPVDPESPLGLMLLKRRTREGRLEKLLSDEEAAILVICEHIENGGDLIGLAEVWEIRRSDLMRWIYAADYPNRKRAYEDAMLARGDAEIEMLLHEVKACALSDLRQCYGPDGNLLPVPNMPSSVVKALQSVEVDELFDSVDTEGEEGITTRGGRRRTLVGQTKRVKLMDKRGMLELWGKKLKLWVERHEHQVEGNMRDLVLLSMEEPKELPALPAGEPG